MRGELRYAIAFFGAHLAFIPLFALLLPRRVAAVDPDNAIRLLSVLLLAGGITASIAHIAAGRWSDRWLQRHGNRRGVIAIGLVVLVSAQLVIAVAVSAAELFVALIAFQLALNLMFAPLGALLADHVADRRKGRVAGWLNATLPLASLGTASLHSCFRTTDRADSSSSPRSAALPYCPCCWAGRSDGWLRATRPRRSCAHTRALANGPITSACGAHGC